MTTSKEHLEIALGGNMHTSSLTTLAIEEIMTDFAKKYHKEQLILFGVSKRFTEKQMDEAYDKGYTDGINTGNTPM
jgi:hypothetical protein